MWSSVVGRSTATTRCPSTSSARASRSSTKRRARRHAQGQSRHGRSGAAPKILAISPFWICSASISIRRAYADPRQTEGSDLPPPSGRLARWNTSPGRDGSGGHRPLPHLAAAGEGDQRPRPSVEDDEDAGAGGQRADPPLNPRPRPSATRSQAARRSCETLAPLWPYGSLLLLRPHRAARRRF